jgi:hypothetical protein
MTSALRVAASLGVAISILPVAVSGQQPAPRIRTITNDAVRRAVDAAWPGVDHTDSPRSASDSDWSRVREIEGEEITLTLNGMPAVTRYIVADSVSDSGLTVLNLTDPRLPAQARDALASAAWWHSECFLRPLPPGGIRLNRHVQVEAGSVFLDGNKVIDLADIVEQVARPRVAQISYRHRAAKRGLVVGVLVGAVVGVAIMTLDCGVHWNTETASCGEWTGTWVFAGPAFGAGLGAAIGSAFKVTTVVYRAPHGGA